MKPTYYDQTTARKGDVMQAATIGTCVVLRCRADGSADLWNTSTGERFDRADVSRADRLFRIPATEGNPGPADLMHRACLALALDRAPDEVNCIGGASWTVPSDLGPVSVSIHRDDPGSVYIRFTDPDGGWREALQGHFMSSPGGLPLNRFSGKWNVHFSGGDGPLDLVHASVAQAKNRLRKTGAFNPDLLKP